VTTLDGTLLTAWIKALAASGHPGRGHRLLVSVIAVGRSSRRGEADGRRAKRCWERPADRNGADIMSGTLWFTTLGIIYLVLLCTLAVLSFRKGHWVLGLIGFIFPVLWIVGAILPGRRRR
jgi:hypothetical protein